MIYDHISFHTDEQPEINPEQAVQHIAAYYTWAVSQQLHSHAAEQLPLFATWQAKQLSGSQFVLQQLNGGIDETCFNELGNRFTQFYYDDEEEGYGRFMEDYFATLGLQSETEFYQFSMQPEHQQQLNQTFQAAFEQWKNSLRISS